MQHILRVKFITRPSFFFLLMVLAAACARQGAPAGGPRDTRPPEVDTTASTPNYSTRFNQKRIELKFDEWITLSDALTQVVVSPPPAKRPEVVLKGKTVVFTFDKAEVLRPNTTYTLNFGTSVKDLHEGNAAKDLRFVFSTGDFIDSLSFKGNVTDAFSGEPVDNISVMLYENMADSALRKERPYYFSKTDKSGQYAFQNLRSGAFRLVAIEDADQNLKWDGENERFAFLDSTLEITDLLRGLVSLKLFKNQPKFRLVGVNANRYGLLKVGFNNPVKAFETELQAPAGMRTLVEKSQDSLMLWYDLPEADTSWSLRFTCPELREQMALNDTATAPSLGPKFDTIQVKKLSRSDFLQGHRIGFGDVAAPAAIPARGKSLGTPAPKLPPVVKTQVQSYQKPAFLPFNLPIVSVDTARWLLTIDTVALNDFKVEMDTASPRRLVLNVDWKQGKTHTITLFPGAVTDFWGASNTDTLKRIFNVLPEKQLGTLAITLEKIRPGSRYILQILNGTALEETRSFTATMDTQKLVFDHLQVANYTARLIEDLNQNDRWDTGSFKEKRQAEPVFNKKLDALRANWELEVSFSAENILEKKKKQ